MSNTITVPPHVASLYAKFREFQRLVPDLKIQYENASRARDSWYAMLPETVVTTIDKLVSWQVEYQIPVDLKVVRNLAAEAKVEEAVVDQYLRYTLVYHETSERYYRVQGKYAQLATVLQNELFPV
jgi:hypothetical protein